MRIAVPRVLPRRADGARLEHLSATGLALLHRCPELWRRRYLAQERPPRSPAQHLGLAVDAAASDAWRARMQGERLPEDEAIARYRATFAGAESVIWDSERAEALAAGGEAALRLYLAEALPTLRPTAVQRRFDLRLDPDLGWWLIGVIDLETEAGVIDLKVKARHLGQAAADASLQAGIYLAARRAAGRPASRFVFHSLRHGANPSLRVLATARDGRRLDGALARVAMGARLIADLADRHGAEGPWPLADPESWACSARYCPAWADCPGGAGPL